MQFIGIYTDDRAITFMKFSHVPDKLTATDNIVVELIPATRNQFVSDTAKRKIRFYHSDRAASFGPGNLAMGLKYNR